MAAAGGGRVRLSELKGKVVLLDFWATWCLPCEESIPHLQALHETHRPAGLEVLGISLDDDPDRVPPFARAHGMTYRVALDEDKEVMDLFGISSIPTTVLIDRSGLIRRRWLGFNPIVEAEMAASLKELLAEKP